jgi:hypothetical protein
MPDLALIHVNEDDIAKAEKATEVPIVNDGENKTIDTRSRYFSSERFSNGSLPSCWEWQPEWVEALKLLNKLTVGAPLLASVLDDEKTTSTWALMLSKTRNGGRSVKIKMASYYDDASFGEKGRKFIDMVSEISSLADISELRATLILHRLLGHKCLLYDAVKRF